MKKITLHYIIVLMLISNILFIVVPIENVRATASIYVDGDQISGWYDATHVKTVGEAITNASNDDIVYIYAGTYTEENTISKSLSFIGNGSDTILNGNGAGGSTLLISSDDINLTDLTIQHSNSGECIGSYAGTPNNLNITNCTFQNSEYGFYFNVDYNNINITNCTFINLDDTAMYVMGGVYDITFENCTFNECDKTDSLAVLYGDNDVENLTVNNCTFVNNNCDLCFERLKNSSIEFNSFESYLWFGTFNVPMYNVDIYNNTFTASGVTDEAIYLNGHSGGEINVFNIYNNTIDGYYALCALDVVHYTSIYDNTVSNCDYGLYFWEATNDMLIYRNTFENCTDTAIYCVDADDMLVYSNKIYDCKDAFHIDSTSTSNYFYDNVIDGTTNDEVYNDANNWWNTTPVQTDNILGGSWTAGNFWSGNTEGDTGGDGLTGRYTLDTAHSVAAYDNHPYCINAPTNDSANYNGTLRSLNLSWNPAENANRYVVIKNNNRYSTDPSDGTVMQNSSVCAYNESSVLSFAYYTVYSFNTEARNFNLTGLTFSWGAMAVHVFNESKPHEAVVFDIFVTDETGSSTYEALNVSNTHYIDVTDVPYGEDTIFLLEANYYKLRTYYKDLVINTFYNFTFYLPPLETGTEEGGGDDGGNTTDTNLYAIQVIDENNQAIDDVKVEIRRYINTTGDYEEVFSGYTDGYGQVQVNLIPTENYKVVLTKTGFETKYENYIPDPEYYGLGNPAIFKMYANASEFQNETNCDEAIIFQAHIDWTNKFILVNFTAVQNDMTNAFLYVDMYNMTTLAVDRFYSNSWTNDNSFQVNISITNTSNDYIVYITFNTTNCSSMSDTITFSGIIGKDTFTSTNTFNTMITNWLGWNPFGWANLFCFIVLIAGCFSFGQRNAGIGLLMSGGVLLFINSVVGLSVIGITVPILLLVMGILVQWRNQRKEDPTS